MMEAGHAAGTADVIIGSPDVTNGNAAALEKRCTGSKSQPHVILRSPQARLRI
jgi:hypothetical protein